MNILLVGAGVRGGVWKRVCEETPDVELVGVVDSDPSRGDTDLSAALAAATEAVIVATPPKSHYEIVTAALSAGKHVLCEKPLSEDLAEVDAMIRQADERGLHLLVGMNFRYLSTSQRIRDVVRAGELGALSHAQFSYIRHRDGTRTDLNDYPLTMPYPMLYEQSIHHFDLLRYCYGAEVTSLVADSWRPSWSTYEGECSVSVLLRFEGGIHVNYVGTWTAGWNRMSFSWRSEFESGVLLQRAQFDELERVEFEPELAISGPRFKSIEDAEKARAERLEPCVPFVDDSRRLLRELVDGARGIEEPVTTARDHVKSLRLVTACIESAETGGWVDVTRT